MSKIEEIMLVDTKDVMITSYLSYTIRLLQSFLLYWTFPLDFNEMLLCRAYDTAQSTLCQSIFRGL